jgi:hypothetical protein
VKAAFDAAFADENKSAVIARLMQEAVDRKLQLQRRARAMASLLELRKRSRPVSGAALRRARMKGRP